MNIPNNSSNNISENWLDLASTAAGIGSLLAKNRAAKIGLGGAAGAGLMANALNIDQSNPDDEVDALAGARGAAATMFALAPFLSKRPRAPIGRENVRIRPYVAPVEIERTTQRPMLSLPDQRITDPSRLLTQLPSTTRTPLAVVAPSRTSALDGIDPRIHAIVSRAKSRSGMSKYRTPSGVMVDTSGGGGSRLSRDMDIPELGKIGYDPSARKRAEYELSKNRYWGDVHPGYYDALSKVDPGAARAMSYLGGQKKIESLFASYEPETLNNILVESMVHFVKKKLA